MHRVDGFGAPIPPIPSIDRAVPCSFASTDRSTRARTRVDAGKDELRRGPGPHRGAHRGDVVAQRLRKKNICSLYIGIALVCVHVCTCVFYRREQRPTDHPSTLTSRKGQSAVSLKKVESKGSKWSKAASGPRNRHKRTTPPSSARRARPVVVAAAVWWPVACVGWGEGGRRDVEERVKSSLLPSHGPQKRIVVASFDVTIDEVGRTASDGGGACGLRWEAAAAAWEWSPPWSCARVRTHPFFVVYVDVCVRFGGFRGIYRGVLMLYTCIHVHRRTTQ